MALPWTGASRRRRETIVPDRLKIRPNLDLNVVIHDDLVHDLDASGFARVYRDCDLDCITTIKHP